MTTHHPTAPDHTAPGRGSLPAPRRAAALFAVAVAALLALLAPVTSPAATKSVVLKGIAFTPGRVTIDRGDRVVWKWRDADVRHNVTSSRFRGASARSSGSYGVTFAKAGSYAYRCTLHHGMNGTVVVRR